VRARRAAPACALCALCALAVPPADGAAQSITRVSAGWGVDTLTAGWSEAPWHDAAAAIYRAWSEYLLADPHLQAPTPLWSAAEQQRWPAYDLTAGIAYKGMPATVLGVRPVAPDRADEYIVQTLFAAVAGTQRDVRPVALTRVHAVREGNAWVFANALPRYTRGWRHETVGPVTYVVDPAHRFDASRAARGIAFADSLAHAFGVPPLQDVTYVVARSPDELHRALGVEWTFGAQGHGYALPWNRLILSGDGAFGEENRHELVHYVLAPILEERRTHPIISEGVATWLGGTVGRGRDALLAEYATFVRDRPDVTLDAILDDEGPDRGWYPGGALLVMMVHEQGGTPALRRLLAGGRSNDALRATLVDLLGVSWDEVATSWHARAARGR
jgi:hypothetical protein